MVNDGGYLEMTLLHTRIPCEQSLLRSSLIRKIEGDSARRVCARTLSIMGKLVLVLVLKGLYQYQEDLEKRPSAEE